MSKKIIVGADPCGYDVKEIVKAYLIEKGYEVEDVGTTADEEVIYYQVGYNVASRVGSGEFEKGLLFCGTGMGVSIVANKVPGVYCGLVECEMTARLCRIINNCNIMAMGGFLNGGEKAKRMVDAFLDTEFASPNKTVEDTEFLKVALDGLKELEKKIYDEAK